MGATDAAGNDPMTEATQRRLATGIAGAAGLIAVLTLLARVAGFGRVLVFADAVRARGVGEIYQSVNTVPNVLFEVAAGGVLAAVIVPLVAHRIGSGERAEADHIAGALLSWALLLLILGILLAVLARPVSTWLVADFDPAARDVATTLVRILRCRCRCTGSESSSQGCCTRTGASSRRLWRRCSPASSSSSATSGTARSPGA